MRERHSRRMAFDLNRPVSESQLAHLLEAARLAPTAHNMQNFEIIAVDDHALLEEIAHIRVETSEVFIRENYAQLSFSEEELERKGTGLLARMFPPSWLSPDATTETVVDFEHAFLGSSTRNTPLLMIVLYDGRKRAPASEHDLLGMMSLGCVMENIWLMAETLGLGMQILSVFSAPHVEHELHRILGLPFHIRVAFGCRLGHPAERGSRHHKVRRPIASIGYRNRYGQSWVGDTAVAD
jgi:nitroreductase